MNLLERKKILLDEMLDFTRKQTQAITEDSLEDLNDMVSHKQKIINEINRIDDSFEKEYESFKNNKNQNLEEETHNLKVNVTQAVSEIINLIKQISILEKENQSKAKRLLEAFGNKASKVGKSLRSQSAYSDNTQKPCYFINKKT